MKIHLLSFIFVLLAHAVYTKDSVMVKDSEKAIDSGSSVQSKQADSLNGSGPSAKRNDTISTFGKLIINVYPLTSSILINKVNIGTGNSVVDNLRPGLYEITVCNETAIRKKYVTVYPSVVSTVNIVADDYHIKLLPLYKFLMDEYYASGPGFEVGFQHGYHYGAFEYFWATNGAEKSGQHSYDYVSWYGYDTFHISGQYKEKRYFSGWGFKYIYNNVYVNAFATVGIGCKVGYLKIFDRNKNWDTYIDSSGVKKIYGGWPSIYYQTISRNYFSPVIRASFGRKKYQLCIDYEYYIGEIYNQMLTASISYQIY